MFWIKMMRFLKKIKVVRFVRVYRDNMVLWKFFHSISSRSVWIQALCFYLKMEAMLIQKSCKYCGRIHAEGYICSKKPIKRKRIDDAVRFRNSSEWNRKRLEIRARDNYLCQICIRELYGTRRKYNCEGLQVHLTSCRLTRMKRCAWTTAIWLRCVRCTMRYAIEARYRMMRSER